MLPNRASKTIAFPIFTLFLALLASCSNSSAIENLVSADPQLSENASDNQQEVTNGDSSPTTIQSVTADDAGASSQGANSGSETVIEPEASSEAIANLAQFPDAIPLYRPAELQQAKLGAANETGRAVWRSPDAIDRIAADFQERLRNEGWEIIQPFNLAADIDTSEAVASKNDLEITIALERLAAEAENDTDGTELTIAYQPVEPNSDSETTAESTPEEILSAPADTAVEEAENTNVASSDSQDPVAAAPATATEFDDIDEVPEQYQQYVSEVAELGILTPYTKEGVATNRFAPNEPITRSEYARWLIAANNKYYQDSPSQKIYQSKTSEKPIFKDVNPDSPDFGAIQGLAEAGLIPSILTDDSSQVLFQPNAPLTREDLVTWKVPLDTRQALPKADIEAIRESWGFQDAGDIDTTALSPLFADYQNRDRSNVGRSFGYTTLFQPKKAVTRAEAAASLWYFGFQGDGVSAPEVGQ